jgi:hypothetical protein
MLRRRVGRKFTAAVIFAVAANACIGGTVASGIASATRCTPRGSTTLETGARARVYSLPTGGHVAEVDPESVRVFGCLLATNRPMLLGRTFAWLGEGLETPSKGRITTEPIALHAPWVSYATTANGVDFGRLWVLVRNLRTGETPFAVSAELKAGIVEATPLLDGIAVTATGTAAWISTTYSPSGKPAAREVAFATSPEQVVLAEGLDIDSHSLQLHGHTVSWSQGGTQHTAQLP